MPEIIWTQLLVGLILCLLGWTLYWSVIHVAGGVIGVCFGVSLSWIGLNLLTDLDPGQMSWIVPLGGIGGFVAGMIMMRGLHRFVFFFVGAGLGMSLGQALFIYLQPRVEQVAQYGAMAQGLLVLICSILVGGMMVYGSRWIVILLTSIIGSLLCAMAISDPLALLGVLPLALGSFFLQTGLLRRVMPDGDDDDEDD